MEANLGGGTSHVVLDDWRLLDRFLILGSESSFYAPAAALENLACDALERLLAKPEQWPAVLDRIINVSVAGRAKQQTAGLFALATCIRKHPDLRRAAMDMALIKVCRNLSTLAELLTMVKPMSWGRHTRKALGRWLTSKPPLAMAYQVTKYTNRSGWTGKDLLRMVHPSPKEHASYAPLWTWIAKEGELDAHDLDLDLEDKIIVAYLNGASRLRQTDDVSEALTLIKQYGFGWEHVGKQVLLKDACIWEAFLEGGMPSHALIRNVRRMLAAHVPAAKLIPAFQDSDRFRAARVHPLQLLQLYKVLREGCDSDLLIAAVEAAFYRSFETVEPTGARLLVAVDVSGSMDCPCVGMAGLTARDAAAALAMVVARRETGAKLVAFSESLTDFLIGPEDGLQAVYAQMDQMNFSFTDCSAPIVFALEQRIAVDAFVIITDNETNFNIISPSEALKRYRQAMGIDAKLIVLATSATRFSIADPEDGGMLDIAGMDAGVFGIVRDFITNRV